MPADSGGEHDLLAARVAELLATSSFTGAGPQAAADAAAAYVRRYRPELWDEDGEITWPPDVELGAAMLAHRWWQRRGAPLGTADYADFGGSPILRYDPDVAKLIGLGSEGGFVFGGPSRRDDGGWRWGL